MKKSETISRINEILTRCDRDTLDAVLMALASVGPDTEMKDRIIRRVRAENDPSKLDFLWELIIRL